VSSEPIATNEYAIAFPDGFPVSDGHTLIVPRRHVSSLWDLSASELEAIWKLAGEVRALLASEHSPDGFNVGVNDGAAAGQTVDHAHLHIIPRYAGDVPDPRGGIRYVIPDRARYWPEGQPSERSLIRFADNRLDNLVPAHAKCNRAKLDFLASDEHIERWLERNEDPLLQSLATEQSWDRSPKATEGIARAVYFGLPDGSPLWVAGERFKESRQSVLRRVLG